MSASLGTPGGSALGGEVAAQEKLRLVFDQPFGKRSGLDQKEPPEIAGGECAIGLGVHGGGRCDIEHGDMSQDVGVVQGHAMGDAAAAVVTDHGEAGMTQRAHYGELIARHRSLRVVLMIVTARSSLLRG